MAEIVQHKARAQEQRHQTAVLQQAQAEQVWVKGIDEVVQTLEGLVQALKQTRQFPHVALLLHARSPQGTSTYMRRGTLLSLKGLEVVEKLHSRTAARRKSPRAPRGPLFQRGLLRHPPFVKGGPG
ncbi:MAG: hypothetical protein AB1816_14595, partial [Bacillota bacterium]